MNDNDNNLTKGTIYSHLIKLAIPASMGMMFDTLYNLTDNWYAGMISDTSLVGLSLASIVFLLLIAMTVGLQSGTSAIVAPDFAKKHSEKVKTWIANSLSIGLIMSVLILALGFVFSDNLLNLLSDDKSAKQQGWDYLFIIIIGNSAYAISSICAGALIAMGNTKIYRNVLVIGFFANIILNPILTFQLNMGIRGLALATLLIKIVSAIYLFQSLHKFLHSYIWPQFNWTVIKSSLRQIIPASLNFLTIIVGAFFIVAFVGRFGSESVAGYSVALRIEQVLLLPVLGLSSAVMALVGQNYGVNNIHRVHETYTKSLKLGLLVSVVFIPIMIFASPLLIGFFTDNKQMIEVGRQYLQIDATAFYAYVIIFTCVSVLQAIKQPLFPLVVGLSRQLILPVGINYILIVKYGYPLITLFWSVAIIVIVSAIVMMWYSQKQINQLIK
jgi:putative MATE family efflux protein